ncbi:Phage tail fiber repeat protein [compost metagenome]
MLKKDPVTDGNETFNVQTMLNDNWDKIDAAVGEMDIPDASLTVKGKVQLSSETDSDAEDRAATPKAVSDVALQAKSYTDQQIGLVTETGIPKLVSYPLLVTATTDGQTEFEIPLDLFDANSDTLLVSINRATLDSTRYTVTNAVRDGSGQVMQRAKITLLTGVNAGSKISMVVLKNVPIGPEGAINGAVLAVDSVPMNRVNGLQEKIDAQLADVMPDTVPHLGTTINSGDAYSISTTKTIGTNRKFTIKFNASSTSAPTLKINSDTAYPIKKANGNAAKIYASVYTLFWDGLAFILQGEGGEYGTATAADVRSTKTVGTEIGVQQGTLDLTNITPNNLRKGVVIDGVTGSLVEGLVNSFIHLSSSSTLFIAPPAAIDRANIVKGADSSISVAGYFNKDSTYKTVSFGAQGNGSTAGRCGFTTDIKLDLTDVKYIMFYVIYSFYNTNRFMNIHVGVRPTKPSGFDFLNTVDVSVQPRVVSDNQYSAVFFDARNINGEFYITGYVETSQENQMAMVSLLGVQLIQNL